MDNEQKIIVVEDSGENSAFMAEYIKEMLGCCDVNTAIAESNLYYEISKQKYDVIVLDLWLHGGLFTSNAIDIVKKLRKQFSFTGKIIVQTGDAAYEKACIEAGADCYVRKSQDSLIKAIVGEPYKQDDFVDVDSIIRGGIYENIESKTLRLK